MCCVTVAAEGLRRVCARRLKRIWAHDRGMGQPEFFDRNLLGSFNAREFKSRMHMNISTFEYLYSTFAPSMYKHAVNYSNSCEDGGDNLQIDHM